MKTWRPITFAALFIFTSIFSQETETHEDHPHHHHKNEIGISNAPVYFLKEKEFAYGLHLHYVRKFENSKFGVGLGYERVFDDHQHNTFGIVGSYNPTENWTVNLSPGITFEKGESKAMFALHAETSYDFEFENFHLGPVLEVAYDPEDYHISLGLHVGFGF